MALGLATSRRVLLTAGHQDPPPCPGLSGATAAACSKEPRRQKCTGLACKSTHTAENLTFANLPATKTMGTTSLSMLGVEPLLDKGLDK